ncbi:MAG: aldose 1-epimerase family protein [Lachnospiraceae bacterium]|nr:aldose 1-epimerase family protein [Lachnospiraceae bacterium]
MAGYDKADYTIKNDVIEAGINKKGAELVSLVRIKDGRQYMWNGDAAYWNRVSPVLFPFVGKLNGQRYQYKGIWYEGIAQHAFARDMEFTLTDITEDTIWMKLESSEETYKIYPFDFTFETGYKVSGNMVKVMWRVCNHSHETMYFSIGAHPAFMCPGNNKEGCMLDLHTEAGSVESGTLSGDGVLGKEIRVFPLQDGRLKVKESIFDRDALILDASGIKKVSMEDTEGNKYLSVSFDTPLLGIWSPAGRKAPFICIEPWYGRCDREGFTGSLEEREYGNKLESNRVFEQEYTIEIML